LLKPNTEWDGDLSFEFFITGRLDFNFAKDPDCQCSVSGYSTFLNESLDAMKSRMQGCITLDITSTELVSGTECAQDMLFIMHVLKSMKLKVKKPMVLKVDKKGAVNISHNWSIKGRSRHDSICHRFLRELNEEGIIKVFWIPMDDNSLDLFTKNLMGPLFEKHVKVYCGKDKYMNKSSAASDSQGEGVGKKKSMIHKCDVIPGNVESRAMTPKGHLESRRNTKVKSTSGINASGENAILDNIGMKPRSNPSHKHGADHRRKAV
jgi:hypothetical protein